MPSPMEVRPIRSEEYLKLKELRLHALADAPMAFGSTYEREAAFADSEWQQRATDGAVGDERITFIAERDGTWLGLASGLHMEPSSTEFQLIGMFVDTAERGSGAAAELIESVAAWARQRGGTRLSLWVTSTNERAIRRYTHCGFVATGETEPLPHTPSLTEMKMALPLSAGS